MRGIAGELAQRLASRALALLQRTAPRPFRRALGQSVLESQLRQLKARGCGVELLLSQGDPARELLAALLPGGELGLLDGLMRIVEVEGADHAFVMRRTRDEFFALLCDFLDAPPRQKARAREKAA